ncbi:MAG: aldehyde reductase, partial [Hyphomonas sp.]|nr:aldehyde reductase [Hyphomonas sp.]
LTQLLSGKLPGTPRVGFGIVDVRDVAAAHVLAMTNPAAAGERFLVCDKFMWFSEVADTLRGQIPAAYEKKLPKGELPGWVLKLMASINPAVKQVIPELNRERNVSNEKARRVLGWQPRTAEEAIISGAKSLIAHKAV